MQRKPCEKFLKLPQNHRFDEFSIFMNFIRGANTHISVGEVSIMWNVDVSYPLPTCATV